LECEAAAKKGKRNKKVKGKRNGKSHLKQKTNKKSAKVLQKKKHGENVRPKKKSLGPKDHTFRGTPRTLIDFKDAWNETVVVQLPPQEENKLDTTIP
jgi:hypothetical protein